MSRGGIEETLQEVQELSAGARPPAPGTLSHAQSFISQTYAAVAAAGGPAWVGPTVEVGGGGVVVFLWQDGQRGLSVSVGPAGPGAWVYEPGQGFGAIAGLDFASRLARGSAGPEEFALRVWSPWCRGREPAAA